MLNDFYIYGHYDRHGNLRYLGKGKNRRAWQRQSRNSMWKQIFDEYFPDVKLLHYNLTEDEALNLEKELILKERETNSRLINICDGGVGGRSGERHWFYGKPRSKETRRRIAATKRENPDKSIARPWLGKKRDPELIKKLVEAAHTPEAIAKSVSTRKENGWSPSEEHRAAISEKLAGKNLTEDHKSKISAAKKGRPNGLKGRVMPESQRQAISAATMGRRPLTPEEQAKRLATWKARGMTTRKARAVVCIELGKTFRCAKDAAIELGCSHKHIQACCTGRRPRHRGYTWKYAEKETNVSS